MKRILSKLKHAVRLSKSSTPNPVIQSNAGPPQDIAVCGSPVLVSVPEHSQAEPVSDGPQLNTPLETLPPEVRRNLLSILGLEELSTLVHASPVFYQQYFLDRRSLLCKSLETTLGGVTVDACAVYRTGVESFSGTRTSGKVRQFLKSYEDQRSSTQYSNLTKTLTQDEAVDMVAFYSSTIKPLVRHYTSWTLANLDDKANNLQSYSPPLSKTERTRLLRALYRFQLCCNLFGVGRHGTYGQLRLALRPIDILESFICIFEPWEVEEIACIYSFSKEKYDQIFRDIRWDVHEENPKFEGRRPPTPEGAFDIDNSWVRAYLLIGTISRGLELLYTIFTIRDHAHLVSAMQEHISWPVGSFIEDEALGETAQSQRRQELWSNRDRKQQRRDLLPFKGDGEPDPPLAWTLIWSGTYSNLYGHYVPDAIRRWGYVMWDAARLGGTGAKEVLARQWNADWGDTDPRDNMQYM
ncbi:hypothetical protein BJ875DRAFT_455875 [Amylocarpus encephaloides]|uniref:Uncharacterized protein n=1 Tax=Amylocarpus encephaloides TaxID=45428 RepID=A0A9P7YMU5_9HELO|nr:hypothetical protein BJ875DRAFT_455875 [Amylocarpus encephaloides]